MRNLNKEDIIRLYNEYIESHKYDLYSFYKWADDMEGPIIPEDRNLNPALWISNIVKEI